MITTIADFLRYFDAVHRRAMRDVGLRYELYLRETAFYQSLADDVAAPIPTIYFAAWDQSAERNAIVMQDLTAWHWADQLTGATQQQAEHCVDALAKLGARHWGADFSHYPWLPDTHRPVLQQVAADYRAVVPITLERLGSFLSPDERAAAMASRYWRSRKRAACVVSAYGTSNVVGSASS